MVSLVSVTQNNNNDLRQRQGNRKKNPSSLFFMAGGINMKYVLARIQVLKNRIPATCAVYIIGDKNEISIPLEKLAKQGYTIVCTFDQAGDAYLILQDNNEE